MRTWLIQRLEKSRVGRGLGNPNPFAFGGGFRNGGLNEEAAKVLAEVFSFEYMGAAEFEFGALPKALSLIYDLGPGLIAETVEVDPKDVKLDSWDKERYEKPKDKVTFYILCHKEQLSYVKEVIRTLLTGKQKLKTSAHLPMALLVPKDGRKCETCGWLELDNGFFFFTDKEMFERTKALFIPTKAKRV